MHDTSDSPITLRRVRGFHVGGARRRVDGFAVETRARVPGDAPVTVDMNGDHMVGQLYATHYQQARRAYALPVLLWHGGGLTGACWDETPDGRPGWLVRAYWNPWARFIFLGPVIMALGGLISLSDRRLRLAAPARKPSAVDAKPEAAPA